MSSPSKRSLYSILLIVTVSWLAGHLLLLAVWAPDRIDLPALLGAGALGGLTTSVLGALLSVGVLGKQASQDGRKRALVGIGLLPPATAALALLVGLSGESPPAPPDQSKGEALAAAIGAGMVEAIVSGVFVVIGFGAGVVLAAFAVWFLWSAKAQAPSLLRRLSLCGAWGLACAVGAAVFLLLAGQWVS